MRILGIDPGSSTGSLPIQSAYERRILMKRILAWAGILAAVAAFLALIVLAVTGAPANILMALVFVVMIVPVLIYGFLIFVKLKKDDRDKDME